MREVEKLVEIAKLGRRVNRRHIELLRYRRHRIALMLDFLIFTSSSHGRRRGRRRRGLPVRRRVRWFSRFPAIFALSEACRAGHDVQQPSHVRKHVFLSRVFLCTCEMNVNGSGPKSFSDPDPDPNRTCSNILHNYYYYYIFNFYSK